MNKEEFIIFLSSEIDNLRSEIQRPGWTNWAMAGAAAALVWVLITLVEEGGYSLKAVASLLLVIWLLHIFYNFIKFFISQSPPPHSSRGRFLPPYKVSANRLGIILSLAQYVFLLIIVWQFSTELGGLATKISFAAVSFLLFFALAALVVSFARFPLPLNPRKKLSSAILPIIFIILMLISVWYHLRFLWISPGGTTVYDVRFALVIAAIFYLTSRLVSVSGGAITLDLLTTIRREFLLGKINLDMAIRQADIALTGMRVSDLLENYVSKLLSLYRDASAEFNNSASLLDQLKKLQSEIEAKPLPKKVTSRHQLLVALDSSVEKTENIITVDIPRAYKPIKRRLNPLFFARLLEDSSDFNDLIQKLEDANNGLIKQSKDFTTDFVKFRQIIQHAES